jgi:hypothetical protein
MKNLGGTSARVYLLRIGSQNFSLFVCGFAVYRRVPSSLKFATKMGWWGIVLGWPVLRLYLEQVL